MKLWVLKYFIGSVPIYLTPDGSHTNRQHEALKFKEESEAKSHLASCKKFLDFEPVFEEIEEVKNRYLQDS